MKAVYVTLVIGLMLGAVTLTGFSQLDKLVKGAGIGILIDRSGPEIDKFVNNLTGTRPDNRFGTKVVPIVSLGNGTHVGAAQVMGPPNLIKTVRAVAQVEGDFLGRSVRVKGLIPITTDKPGKSVDRVVGVGVSAVLDIRL